MGVCPTRELVERYLSGDCSEDERLVLEKHITKCDDCRDLIEATRSMADLPNSPPLAGTDDEETQLIDADDLPTIQLDDEATAVSSGPGDYTKSVESMFEGYRITETLPRGGQAVVYKAVHIATKTNVAIKVLLPTLLASERARYYFEREAELIASLDHPNIVSIRDSGIIHHQYYFVMQYIDGEPLRRYVQAERLSFRGKVELVNKICSAITYAHQQGIIHRDLKFANILVDKRGEPHILDFGLAKAVGIDEQADDKAVATMTGQWAGSLSTMSPEQASGQPHLIDVRTDVYSLGIILYTLLTGQYPYDVGGTTLEALKNIQEADPTRPRHIIPKFNSEMEAILLTTLEKEREKRYQSAAELQSDIENWLEGRPIRVKSISTAYLLKKIIGRHRYTSTVVGLLAIIVLAFAFISFELFKRSENALDESEKLVSFYTAEAKDTTYQLQQVRPHFFARFLEAWRAGEIRNAARMARYFREEPMKMKAAAFLLRSKGTPEEEKSFRGEFSHENLWFANFIVAEHRFKKATRREALDCYQLCYGQVKEMPVEKRRDFEKLLIEYVRARLYVLEGASKEMIAPSGVQAGGLGQ